MSATRRRMVILRVLNFYTTSRWALSAPKPIIWRRARASGKHAQSWTETRIWVGRVQCQFASAQWANSATSQRALASRAGKFNQSSWPARAQLAAQKLRPDLHGQTGRAKSCKQLEAHFRRPSEAKLAPGGRWCMASAHLRGAN